MFHIKTLKASARRGPQWSSVSVGIDLRRGGLNLPMQGASDMRAARVVYRGQGSEKFETVE